MKAFTLLLACALVFEAACADDTGGAAPPAPATPSPLAPAIDSSGPLAATEPVESLPPPEEPAIPTEPVQDRPPFEAEHPSTGYYPDYFNDPEQNLGAPDSSNCAGNPITLSTGNKFQKENDIASLRVDALQLTRFYNSQRKVHWTHTYSSYIRFHSWGLKLIMPDGQAMQFVYSADRKRATSPATAQGHFAKVGDTWEYRDMQKDTRAYDAKGRLIQWRGHSGYAYSIRYDNLNAIVTDSYTNTLTLMHDSYGRLQTASTSAVTVRYAYDKAGRLLAATRDFGTVQKRRQYHYEDPRFVHYLTGITDERGIRFATWTYDGSGRANSSEHADGAERVTLRYENGGPTVLTNALGKESVHHFTVVKSVKRTVRVEGKPSPNCAMSDAYFSYDDAGNLVERTDENGVKTRYAYNALGLETARTEAYGTAIARTITTQRDSDGVLALSITEPGKKTVFRYDTQGRLIEQSIQGSGAQ